MPRVPLRALMALTVLATPMPSAATTPPSVAKDTTWTTPAPSRLVAAQRRPPNDVAERSAPRRATVSSMRTIDLAALTTTTTTPRPELDASKPRPNPLPAATAEAPELRLLNGARITLRGQRLGRFRHRFRPDGEVRPGGFGGDWVECAAALAKEDPAWRSEPRVDPISWWSVQPDGDDVVFEEGSGWFDGYRCRVVTLHHSSARARRIAGEVYAFVERCPRCKPGNRQRLRVIHTTLATDLALGVSPKSNDSQHWQLSFVSLPLEPNTAARQELLLHQDKAGFPTVGASDIVVIETRTPRTGSASALSYMRRDAAFAF
jgi:hypothetical protein